MTKLALRCAAFTSMALAFAAVSCQSAYYGAWEKLGYHKRDILVERVEEAKTDQVEAQEQFETALDKFRAVVSFEGGDLEEKYEDLKAELAASETRAEAVRERIASVQEVAQALFDEWESELDEYTSPELRARSEAQLRTTQARYARLMQLMRRAEAKMEPVLAAFRDQVLFLKHNLNARAVASLQGTAAGLEEDVAALVRDMEASIREANDFIAQMQAGPPQPGGEP